MKAWNPNPSAQLVRGLYNDINRRTKEGPTAAAEPVKKQRRKLRATLTRSDYPPRLFVGRAQTHDHAAKQQDFDSAHIAWLASSLLSEVRRCGRSPINAGTRLALIHELSKVD